MFNFSHLSMEECQNMMRDKRGRLGYYNGLVLKASGLAVLGSLPLVAGVFFIGWSVAQGTFMQYAYTIAWFMALTVAITGLSFWTYIKADYERTAYMTELDELAREFDRKYHKWGRDRQSEFSRRVNEELANNSEFQQLYQELDTHPELQQARGSRS